MARSTVAAPARAGPSWTLLAAAATALLVLVLMLLWGITMRRGLNHDEHQFVASAALIARNGLLPYRDFPYFHVPTLSLIYALLFHFTDYLLLAARAFSVACSWLMLTLLCLVALFWLRNLRPWTRLGVAALTILLLMATPSFLHASGRAWNHDLPVLLAMAAACLHGYWLANNRQRLGWLFFTGLLVGLAAGTRLSFAFASLPFVLSVFAVETRSGRRAWGALFLFCAGALAGLVPALYLFALAPDQFIFGNLNYAQLNTLYYQQVDSGDEAMTLGQKALMTLEIVVGQPGNLLLALLCAVELWRVRTLVRPQVAPELLFLLLLLPFLLVGAYTPTPMQVQYIYPFFPFFALIFLAALAHDRAPKGPIGLLAAAAAVAAVLAAPRFWEGAEIAFAPDEWFPRKVHLRGEYLAATIHDGRVLTLAPIYPLEGKVPIYAELVTGPMGWRVTPLVDPAERTHLNLVGLDALDAELSADPPRALLTNLHDDDLIAEEPLQTFAVAHGYVPLPMPDDGTLWVEPMATWGDTIRLGAARLPVAPVQPGATIIATFQLQATQPITRNLNVLVRLVAPDSTELLRSEGWPWGRPASSWQPGDVWPDGHTLAIPAGATPGPYRVEMSFYDPETLDLLGDQPATVGYVVVGDPALPPHNAPASVPPIVTFGDCIDLLATALPPDTWQPGMTEEVELTWQRTTSACGRFTMFVHLVGPDGLAAQRDQEPYQGFYPTDRWLVDVPVADRYAIEVSAGVAPDTYRLLVGMYDPVTGQRLPAVRNGQAAGDAYQVATVQVGNP